MSISKKIKDNELYLYMNGKLIYKRWLDTGQSKVFDVMAYDKYTLTSIRDMQVENPSEKLIVKAKLRLRASDDNGRKTPIKSGYSPNHVFEYKNDILETYIGRIVFDGADDVYPGEERIVSVEFLQGQHIENYLQKGQKWFIYEGPKQIGEAEIIE